MLYPTVPFPLPLAPLVMVSQLALLVAVQLHPAPAVTLAELDPAAAALVAAVGATLKVHAAACVTVTV